MWKMQEHFSTKESIQRKGDPDAACFLRSVVFIGGCQKGLQSLWQRAASLPHPKPANPDKNASARSGIRDAPSYTARCQESRARVAASEMGN